jgi:hypothetical protein
MNFNGISEFFHSQSLKSSFSQETNNKILNLQKVLFSFINRIISTVNKMFEISKLLLKLDILDCETYNNLDFEHDINLLFSAKFILDQSPQVSLFHSKMFNSFKKSCVEGYLLLNTAKKINEYNIQRVEMLDTNLALINPNPCFVPIKSAEISNSHQPMFYGWIRRSTSSSKTSSDIFLSLSDSKKIWAVITVEGKLFFSETPYAQQVLFL